MRRHTPSEKRWRNVRKLENSSESFVVQFIEHLTSYSIIMSSYPIESKFLFSYTNGASSIEDNTEKKKIPPPYRTNS